MCGKRWASFILFSHHFPTFKELVDIMQCLVVLWCIPEYVVFDTQKDCYEVYALVPGLLREEVSISPGSLGFQLSSLCFDYLLDLN